ncbi:uncharacterized protein PV06_11162 [Exophiala oligosperma]|uniref:Uncharacterized protein n=1 Tax=Exophiala oligosperma TaxID=215243 RepID=A0A0D2D314_9EURO|nr:uncharacterized protein PV06_11162 [Exophiala oligosperma]KIW36650.1 hypothetical protein PV06_11162 [Exophiala oligosperma]
MSQADLRALKEVIEEIDAQYINHDMYESDLIPVEWKVKEAEKNLYEDLTGEAFLDPAWSEGDGRSSPKVVPQLPSIGTKMRTTESPHQPNLPLDGAIVEDANMYSAGGIDSRSMSRYTL